MAVERRFLIASSLARLIQRESETISRIVEGHFPPRAEHAQFVRVEREYAALILLHRDAHGTVTKEQAEIPQPHAVALMDVAAGTVAYDRMAVVLPGEGRAQLDRFILPSGIDVLTVLTEEGRAGDVSEWFGPEVTGGPEFEASNLALHGLQAVEEITITARGMEALLDVLEGRPSHRSYRSHSPAPVRQPAERRAAFEGAPAQATSDTGGVTPIEAGTSAKDPVLLSEQEEKELPPERGTAENPPEAKAASGTELDHSPSGARQPRLRTNVQEADEGLARIARTLAPRRSRPG